MNRFILPALLLVLLTGVRYGYGQSKLAFTGTYKGTFYPLDSILIEDINTGSKSVKHYPDTVLKLLITDLKEPVNEPFLLSQNYPNPFSENTNFNLQLPSGDKTVISVCTLTGTTLLKSEYHLAAGNHSFTYTGGQNGIYLLSVRTTGYSASLRLVKYGSSPAGWTELKYNGPAEPVKGITKGGTNFIYNTGDNLVFTGYMTDKAGHVVTDTVTDALTASKTYTFDFKKLNSIIILMYHRITDGIVTDEYDRMTTDFENDLKYLLEKNYRVLSISDLRLLKDGVTRLETDGIIITFDDGYKSIYEKAYPLLMNYNMPATFFLTTEWISSPEFVTWSDVWNMYYYLNGSGERLFTIGSHTSSHPFLEKSIEYFPVREDYLNFLNTELKDSKDWITDVTGQDEIFLSLPYGDGAYNQDIINTAVANGYSGIRTSVWKSFTVDEINMFALPSIPILTDTPIKSIESFLDY